MLYAVRLLRSKARIGGALLAVGISAVALGSRAGGAAVDLTWHAPADRRCPDGRAVVRAVGAFLGSANSRSQMRVTATAEITETRSGAFRISLVTWVGTTRAERVLEDRSCRAVADAAVVILAWLVDPQTMISQERPAPLADADASSAAEDAGVPPPPPPVAPGPLGPEAPPPAPSVEGSRFFSLELGPALDFGTLPGVAPGAYASAAFTLGLFRADVSGAYWPWSKTTTATSESGAALGGTFSLFAGGVDLCILPWSPRRARLALPLCAGAELDWMRGAGFGALSNGAASREWVAPRAKIGLELVLAGPWFAALSVAGVVPLARPEFAVQDAGEVHRAAAVAGRAALEAGIRF